MNIGLLGFGVVGRGVYDMLADRDDIRAAWVLCRRDLGELTARTTYEMQDILNDPSVDTVVEVMGGLHPAYEYVVAALRAGKNVVSSNKYLMCRYYDELNALAKEHGAALRCTAAVGGGIPWLTNLEKAARANHISRVWGILNGTTNYIMDAMHHSDVDFADVLAQAQALGYAEADPSADIDGLDIQRKLILSANAAFGVSLREADVPVSGIRNVRKADIARFQAHGCTCKLIATAEQRGGSISAYVEPTLLGSDALEAAVPANFNLISMDGDRMGVQSFFGQGRGRYPTAYQRRAGSGGHHARRARLLHRFLRSGRAGQCRRAAPLLCAHARRAAGAGRPRRGRLGRRRHHAAHPREPDARAHGAGARAGRRELFAALQ